MPTTRWVSILILIAVAGLGCGGGSQTGPPVCGLSASTLDFGSVEIGQTKDLTLTVTNSGQGVLGGTLAENCTDYSIQGPASYNLGAGTSATFTIRFAPTLAGTRDCTLSVPGCSNVSLTGVATTGPCGIAPTAIDFGVVPPGSHADRTFVITNNGSTTLDGTVSSPCPVFTIQGNTNYSLSPAASTTITVRFTPATGGPVTCTIETGSGICSDVSVSGISPLGSYCVYSDSTLDFGSVMINQTSDLTLTVTNAGSGTLSGALAETCTDYSILGNTSYNLGAGASATFTIRFAPTVAGTRDCTLLGLGCGEVLLTGVATTGPCGIAPTAIDFGVVPLGSNADRTFTITNTGSTTLDGTVSSPCPVFTIQGNASYSLAPAASTSFTVRYTPLTGGTPTCTIETGSLICSDVSVSASTLELDSGNIAPGGTYVHTFQGTPFPGYAWRFNYDCKIHPGHAGAVVVDPNSNVMTASVSIVHSGPAGFEPGLVTVGPGAVVTWTNNDSLTHTVTDR